MSRATQSHSSTSKRREPNPWSGLSPFHMSALDYLKAGFLPIPLPLGKKGPPPSGTPNSLEVTKARILEWMEDPRPRNIGTIVPDGLVVLDIDGMPGRDTLRELEMQFGELDNTWISFRGDPNHYHLWFRTVDGLNWPGKLGAGLDVIHRHYRYAVLPPSIHPDGTQYRWAKP